LLVKCKIESVEITGSIFVYYIDELNREAHLAGIKFIFQKAKMHQKQNTIKIKVVGWFLLAALAVLLTGIISYNSYRELLISLENPSNQQTKLIVLGDILADITKAEAKMRAYALTRDTDLLDTYQSLVISINQELEAIKTTEPVNDEFNVKVDSVSHLLNDQMRGVASFIELKSTLNQLSFSSIALEEINSTTDSIPALRTTTTTTTTTTTVEPLPPAGKTDRNRKNTKRQQKKKGTGNSPGNCKIRARTSGNN